MTLVDLVRHATTRYARSRAVLHHDGWWTFAELARVTTLLTDGLRDLGVRRGDRVVAALDNRPELVALDHAIWRLGAVRVALSARLHGAEVAWIAGDCEARLVLCEGRHLDAVDGRSAWPAASVVRSLPPDGPYALTDALGVAVPDVSGADGSRGHDDPVTVSATAVGIRPDDVAALMYTSGSTGRPKGAIATHRAWVAMMTALAAELPPVGPGNVVLHVAPMSHFGGAVGHACTFRGAAVVTMPRFAPQRVLDALRTQDVTVLPLVPTMLRALVERVEAAGGGEGGEGRPLPTPVAPHLRAIAYGGSASSPELLHRAGHVFGEVLHQFYGSSEAMVPLTALSARDHVVPEDEPLPRRLGSAGRPTPLSDVRLVTADGTDARTGTVGEIVVRGPTVSPGYWTPGQPRDAVDAPGPPPPGPGWFATGDLGVLDEDGYLYVVDRAKELIVTGGFTVYPREVERVIETLDPVADVAVVGIPHERWGEGVAALVVVRPDATLTADEVVDVCRAHLADFKKPVHVEFVTALPHTSTGKVDRSALRQRFWAGRDRQVGVD